MKTSRENSISACDFGESIAIVQIFEARAASIFGIQQSSNRTIVKLKFRNVCFVQDSRNLIFICLGDRCQISFYAQYNYQILNVLPLMKIVLFVPNHNDSRSTAIV